MFKRFYLCLLYYFQLRFVLVEDQLSWLDATAHCNQHYQGLAAIYNADDQMVLNNLLGIHNQSGFVRIGGRARQTYVYRWSDQRWYGPFRNCQS